jgi:folate-binding protein YgfZ
MNAGNKIFHD